MSVVIGSARSDENGKYSGGKKGDQRQTTAPDYGGEVSRQKFYLHSKGWVILRAKNAVNAGRIASAMATACDNSNIGYSQSDRYSILNVGTATKTATNCDCSSLVRQCVKEATGKDPGDFTTGNEATKLVATGLFDKLSFTSEAALCTGDILVTATKGHTAIVIEGKTRTTATTTTKAPANAEMIWTFLFKQGLPENAVFGLMGNLQAESALNPKNLQNSYEKLLGFSDESYTRAVNSNAYKNFASDAAGYGLAQWTSKGRKQGLLDYARKKAKSIDNLDMQLEYLMIELNGSYKSVLKGIEAAKSIREASDIVLTKFERPKDQSEAVKKYRASLGESLYQQYKAANKSLEDVARDVLNGVYGNGEERKKRLAAAGYNYSDVQREVNRLLRG